jgi:hypothetical protein
MFDVDGDSDVDAFIGTAGGQENRVYLNDGTGLFPAYLSLGTQDVAGAAFGDLNGDSWPDIVLTSSATADTIWFNKIDVSGTFTQSSQVLGEDGSQMVAIGDVNGDDFPDVVTTTSYISGESANRVWLNSGNGYFNSELTFNQWTYSYALALGDVDMDGHLDAVIGNDGAPNALWLNDGMGNFTDSGQSLGGARSESLDLGDLDGDGDLDIFMGLDADHDTVWLNGGGFNQPGDSNLGSGSFSATWFAPMSTPTSRGVTLGDIDLDGDLDCWIGHTYVPSEVWVNQGGRQGGWPGDFIVSAQLLGNSATTTAAMADVDGDGDLDAIEGNLSQPSRLWVNIGVYVNDCDGNGEDDTCQTDQDADGTIDECDPDIDGDGFLHDCDQDPTGGSDCDVH